EIDRQQGGDARQQPEAVPQRRRRAQDKPGGEDQLDVVVLVKVKGERERSDDARGEHHVHVVTPAPRDQERRGALQRLQRIGEGSRTKHIGQRVQGLTGVRLAVNQRL